VDVIQKCRDFYPGRDCQRFMMGDSSGKQWPPAHEVRFTKNFEIQTTHVTQAQYALVTGKNPAYFSMRRDCPQVFATIHGVGVCPNRPVEYLTYDQAQLFITRLNAMSQDGYLYRLPTEAEFEYALRGGTEGPYFFASGSDVEKLDHYVHERMYQPDADTRRANDLMNQYSWWPTIAEARTHEVGMLLPTPYGLYDVIGNVRQWLQDWEGPPATSLQVDPQGPTTGTRRCVRGGHYYASLPVYFARSSARGYAELPSDQHVDTGFRLVRVRK
jgi:formylglycine-generating enzyme required for sulfatase activity